MIFYVTLFDIFVRWGRGSRDTDLLLLPLMLLHEVGHYKAMLVYCYAPEIDFGFFAPQQVQPSNCKQKRRREQNRDTYIIRSDNCVPGRNGCGARSDSLGVLLLYSICFVICLERHSGFQPRLRTFPSLHIYIMGFGERNGGDCLKIMLLQSLKV